MTSELRSNLDDILKKLETIPLDKWMYSVREYPDSRSDGMSYSEGYDTLIEIPSERIGVLFRLEESSSLLVKMYASNQYFTFPESVGDLRFTKLYQKIFQEKVRGVTTAANRVVSQ
nr:hypothetical protein [Nanoarchaeum sp.]